MEKLNFELYTIVNQFITEKVVSVTPFGSGLINNTYKVNTQNSQYILQRLNTDIFINPMIIAQNIKTVAEHLLFTDYPFLILEFLLTKDNQDFYIDSDKNYWRLMPFFENTFSINQVNEARDAQIAAEAFGIFFKYLINLDVQKIAYALPDFHHGAKRWNDFEKALQINYQNRKAGILREIETIFVNKHLLFEIDTINLPLRITHNDTKINNLLFNDQGKVISVIDWDTLMPGTVLSDFGDMVRTYTATALEDETDYSKINVDAVYFEALCKGYLGVTKNFLTIEEKENLLYGASFILFMQAIRFMTDYLNGDIYYKTNYENHNLIRSLNQMKMLESFQSQLPHFQSIINKYK